MFTAIEDMEKVRSAVSEWEVKFKKHSEPCTGPKGRTARLHPELGLWGSFGPGYSPSGLRGYWNVFGRMPRQITVEVNPSYRAISQNVLGLVARAPDGDRWILHRGRLHGTTRVDPEMFVQASKLKPVPVRFRGLPTTKYFLVANVDASWSELQQQMSAYVAECDAVRQHFSINKKFAEEERDVFSAEEGLFPEASGNYSVRSQPERTNTRTHGSIWKALAAELAKRKVKHSNGRVGRFGPDMRTIGKAPILFEIKTSSAASQVHEGVGQLHLYEAFLGKKHKKVLVLPSAPGRQVIDALSTLGITIVHYRLNGRQPRFDTECLRALRF